MQDYHQIFQVTCNEIILQWILSNSKLKNDELKNSFSQIKNYLETNIKNLKPEVEIKGKK